MPWSSNNGGGGWQGGGGGNRGPWGQGPSGGGNQPPDLDELIRKGQEKLREILPGGTGGARGPFIILLLAVAIFLAWSSFFRVNADQQGIVLRFGKLVRIVPSGLHLKFPYPVEKVLLPTVTRINSFHVGMTETDAPIPIESLMLTGDENIADITFTVLWKISDAKAYLFNVADAQLTVKAVAESVMREVVGQSKIDVLQTTGRNDAQNKVKELMQAALDSYGVGAGSGGAGVEVTEVQLRDVDPPAAVIDAFRDVQAARTDQERLQNEATTYANTVVPKARGRAAQITQAAEAYREQIVAEAEGEAKRFLLIYNEYKKAKDVTRTRMYLETMETVFGGLNKVLIDPSEGGKSVLPYLPLQGLQTKPDAGGKTTAGSEVQP